MSNGIVIENPIAPISTLPKKRNRFAKTQGPWLLLAVVVAVLVLLPIIPLLLRALADGGQGFRDLAQLPNLGRLLWQTVALGFGTLIVAMVLGTLLALSMQIMPARFRRWLSIAPVLPILIPAVAHVVGFVFLFSPENGYVNKLIRSLPFVTATTGPINVYTPTWIIIYTGITLASFVYLFVHTGLRNLGAEYVLAARANGAGGLRALFTITLPLLRPVFIYSAAVCFLLALGQFTAPLILGRREGLDVITTRMFDLTAQYPVNYGLIGALGMPLLLVALFLVLLQRKLIGDQNRFVGQVSALAPQTPSKWASTVAATFVLLFTIVFAILPMLALIYVSISPFWSGNISGDSLTLANYQQVLSKPAVIRSVTTSLIVSVGGVLLVLPIGMLIALAIFNKDRLWPPIAAALDTAANLPLALPAALMGFGFLFAFSTPGVGLYGTPLSLVIAYAVIMLPFAVRYQLAALIAMGKQTTEASRANGAGALRTFGLVILPLARSGIASAAAIMFVLLVHEFAVSLLLRAPNVTVMSVLLFNQYDAGSYPAVAVIAVVMTVITGIGVALAMLVGGKGALENM